jgi:hypothetical protein
MTKSFSDKCTQNAINYFFIWKKNKQTLRTDYMPNPSEPVTETHMVDISPYQA